MMNRLQLVILHFAFCISICLLTDFKSSAEHLDQTRPVYCCLHYTKLNLSFLSRSNIVYSLQRKSRYVFITAATKTVPETVVKPGVLSLSGHVKNRRTSHSTNEEAACHSICDQKVLASKSSSCAPVFFTLFNAFDETEHCQPRFSGFTTSEAKESRSSQNGYRYHDFVPDPAGVINPFVVKHADNVVSPDHIPKIVNSHQTQDPKHPLSYPTYIRQTRDLLPSQFLTHKHFPKHVPLPSIFPHSFLYPPPEEIIRQLSRCRTCHEILTTLQMYPLHNSPHHRMPYSVTVSAVLRMAELIQFVEFTHHDYINSQFTRMTPSSVMKRMATKLRSSQQQAEQLLADRVGGTEDFLSGCFNGQVPENFVDPISGVTTFMLINKSGVRHHNPSGVLEHCSDTYIRTYNAHAPGPFTVAASIKGDGRVKKLIRTLNSYLKLHITPVITQSFYGKIDTKARHILDAENKSMGGLQIVMTNRNGTFASIVPESIDDVQSPTKIEHQNEVPLAAYRPSSAGCMGYSGQVCWEYNKGNQIFLSGLDFVQIVRSVSRIKQVFDADWEVTMALCSKYFQSFLPLLTIKELTCLLESLGRMKCFNYRFLRDAIERLKHHFVAGSVTSNGIVLNGNTMGSAEMAQVLYAMRSLEYTDVTSAKMITKYLHDNMHSVPLIHSIWMLRSLAELDYVDNDLFMSIAAAAVTNIDEVVKTKQRLQQLLYAMGHVGYRHDILLSRLSTEIVARLHLFSPIELATILRTYAICRCYPRDLFLSVFHLPCWNVPKAPKELNMLPLSSRHMPQLFPFPDTIEACRLNLSTHIVQSDNLESVRTPRNTKETQYSHLGFGGTEVEGTYQSRNDEKEDNDTSISMDNPFPAYWASNPTDPVSKIDIMYSRLYQAYLGFKLEAYDKDSFTFDNVGLARLQAIHCRNTGFWGNPASALHADVFDIIEKDLVLPVLTEHVTKEGLSIDIAIDKASFDEVSTENSDNGIDTIKNPFSDGTGGISTALIGSRRIAVEVDGPYHYLQKSMQSFPPRLNGSTQFKHRLLRGSGWKVVAIPYWEMTPRTSRREKARYIARQLAFLNKT